MSLKILNMMNLLKKLMLFRLLMLDIWQRKQTIIQKLMNLKKIIYYDHSNKYLFTQEFHRWKPNFAARLTQANLARKIILLLS